MRENLDVFLKGRSMSTKTPGKHTLKLHNRKKPARRTNHHDRSKPALEKPESKPAADGEKSIAEHIKELVKLAREQGYLTYGDLNDTLPDTITSPEELDNILMTLRNMDIEIIDASEVDRFKQEEKEEEEEAKLQTTRY